MASTISVQNLIDFARTHVKMIPLVSVGGLTNQPALTMANKIKKRIINKDYNWDWNRASLPPIKTVEDRSEYVVTVNDVGWLERGYAEVFDSTATPKDRRTLMVKRNLVVPHFKGEPDLIALDMSVTKQIMIRVYPIPNNITYQMFIDYQRKPTFIETIECTTPTEGSFAPIPDEFQDVLTQMFLALAFKHAGEYGKYQAEMREATELLNNMAGLADTEEANTGFIPEFNPYVR